ncbi:MAG: hypothetical protein H6742_12800 [Alphaproteobacteria bacterium]|nr:hypothetical protein [Alphaproteobacteria bacterium]
MIALFLACAAGSEPLDSGAEPHDTGGGQQVVDLDTLLVHGDGGVDTFDGMAALGLSAFAIVDGGDPVATAGALEGSLDAFELVVLDEGLSEEGVLWGEASGPGLAALAAWVEGGGILLSTGRSYEVVHGVAPDVLDFVGEESVAGAAEVAPAQTVDATIADASLSALLGANDIEALSLGAGSAPIERAGDAVGVHLVARVVLPAGELPAAPLLTSARLGEGRIVHSVPRLSGDAPADFLQAVQYVVSAL